MLKNSKFVMEQLPPHSPDLNPIENLFAVLKKKVNEIDDRSSLVDKINFVVKNCIEISYINSLIDSIPKRLKSVIKNNGGHTKYYLFLFYCLLSILYVLYYRL